MNDVFGEAILDYQLGKCKEDIITSTSISQDEPLKVSYLFRIVLKSFVSCHLNQKNFR